MAGWGRGGTNVSCQLKFWPFVSSLLKFKPGLHMSGKSQTIGDFTFCRPTQIYRVIAASLSQILSMNLAGNGKCAKN